MNMNQFDLNIDNYDYEEFLRIFKISEINNQIDYKNKLERKCENIKDKCSPNIVEFYQKSKNILLSIFSLMNNKIIQQEYEIHDYIDKIKQMKNLEKYTENDIVNKLINLNNISLSEKEDDNIIEDNDNDLLSENRLNKPNLNTGSRVNPSLNNKNNTNAIYNTFPNDVAPGNLNALKRLTQLLNINLNSCFRNNYYRTNPCDFVYSFPSEIRNVLSMRLASIEIPNSWYIFSDLKKNNFFEINIRVNQEDYNYIIKVPYGNYDVESLTHYLNTTYFCESGLNIPLKYIRFSIDPHNLRAKFEIIKLDELLSEKQNLENLENKKNIRFTLKFVENINQNAMNTFGWLIGFRLGSYIDITECIISEGLFDGGGDRYIYVCVNDYQYNNNVSNIVCFDRSVLNEEVLAKIPMVNGKFSLIINDNNNVLAKIRRYNGPVNLSKLQIKVLDKFGTIIDLNYMDFSLTIELEILYESFNFKNIAT